MAPKNKTPEQPRKLLREAREELDKAQQPLLEQLARCTGPETPWMMAAAGRDDAAVAHAERGAQRAELLELLRRKLLGDGPGPPMRASHLVNFETVAELLIGYV